MHSISVGKISEWRQFTVEFRLSDYLPDELLKNFHFVFLGALAFGIGGYLLGVDMYQEGSSIIFMGITFFLVAAYWGCILGLLTRDLKNVIMLAGAGIFGGIVCLFVANLGGLILLMLMGWLLIVTPLFFLFFAGYYFKKNEKMVSAAFFMLFAYVAIDWILMICNQMFSTQYSMFAPHAFVFALTGLITGGCFGRVMGKTKTMAIFGLVGLSLGSYWITLLHRLFESTNNAVYGYVIAYIFVSVTTGAFLVAGLYYPEKSAKNPKVISGVRNEPTESSYTNVTE